MHWGEEIATARLRGISRNIVKRRRFRATIERLILRGYVNASEASTEREGFRGLTVENQWGRSDVSAGLYEGMHPQEIHEISQATGMAYV